MTHLPRTLATLLLLATGCAARPAPPPQVVSPAITGTDDADDEGPMIRHDLMFHVSWSSLSHERLLPRLTALLLTRTGKVVARCAPDLKGTFRGGCEAFGDAVNVASLGFDLPPGLGKEGGSRVVLPLGGAPLWTDVEMSIAGPDGAIPSIESIEIRRTAQAPNGLTLRRNDEPRAGHTPLYTLLNDTDEAVTVLQSFVEVGLHRKRVTCSSCQCGNCLLRVVRVPPRGEQLVGDSCYAIDWPIGSAQLLYTSVYLLWGSPSPIDVSREDFGAKPPKVSVRGIYRITDQLVFTRSPAEARARP